jgi:paraquat-inducible protein B
MSAVDNNHDAGAPAKISPLRGISGLWLIPIVTVLVGVWMAYDRWANQGPLITIEFASADGVVEGKTGIKSKSITVGQVLSVRMSETGDSVLLEARMVPEVRNLLVEDSRFWVVKPQIGLSGISGLGTILSGQYIEFSPGDSKATQNDFRGLDKPPLTPAGTPGLHITLNSKSDFSYGEGEAILYQGFKVGKIEDIFFNSSERMMYYNAFIEAPYHKLVTHNTRFWNSSGIRAELTPTGVSLQTGNLESVLLGGISFGLPEGELPGEPVDQRAYYQIYPSRALIGEKDYTQTLNYILLVDSSITALSVGNPVVLRGIKVGRVTRNGQLPDGGNLLDPDQKIPIHIEINPARLGLPDTKTGSDQAALQLQQWMKSGMSAVVKSRSPIFGQQIVQLNLPSLSVATTLAYYQETPVIALSKDTYADIANQVGQLVKDISSLPIQDIGVNLNQLLVETTAAMNEAQSLIASGGEVLADVDNQALVNSLNQTTIKVGELAASYSTQSPTNREIRLLLENLTYVLAELGPLLTELKNRPNGLIFSGQDASSPEPESKQE